MSISIGSVYEVYNVYKHRIYRKHYYMPNILGTTGIGYHSIKECLKRTLATVTCFAHVGKYYTEVVVRFRRMLHALRLL